MDLLIHLINFTRNSQGTCGFCRSFSVIHSLHALAWCWFVIITLQFDGTIVDYINEKLMGTIKTFLLGAGTAYAIYFITRKRIDGTSILDDLLDNPSLFMNKAKDYAMSEVANTIKEKLS